MKFSVRQIAERCFPPTTSNIVFCCLATVVYIITNSRRNWDPNYPESFMFSLLGSIPIKKLYLLFFHHHCTHKISLIIQQQQIPSKLQYKYRAMLYNVLLDLLVRGTDVYFYSLFVFWLTLKVRQDTAQLIKIYRDTTCTKTSIKIHML